MEPTHSDGKAVQANAVSLSVVIGGGARDNVKVTDHRHMVTWKVCCWQARTDAKLRGRIQHGDGSHANTSCLHSLQQHVMQFACILSSRLLPYRSCNRAKVPRNFLIITSLTGKTPIETCSNSFVPV